METLITILNWWGLCGLMLFAVSVLYATENGYVVEYPNAVVKNIMRVAFGPYIWVFMAAMYLIDKAISIR